MKLNVIKLDTLIDIYCHCLPKRFRTFISNLIEPLGYRFFEFAQQIYLSAYILKGKEKNSKSDLTMLFLGDKKSLSYLSKIVYDEKLESKKIGNFFIWKTKAAFNTFSSKVDAIFIKTDKFFSQFLRRKGFIIIPEWVEMTLDVSEPLTNIHNKFSKGTKKDIKKIKKKGYSYEISTDPEKLELFYNQMYLPYISKKYEKTALIVNFNYMKKIFENGKLLLVKRETEYVSGSLISIKNDIANLLCMGIRDGKTEYIKQGAAIASDYFHILWAKDNGIKILNFGDSRPFLNDGVFQYKRKWGMITRQSKIMTNSFCFKIYNYSKSIQDFLMNNPFIYVEKDQLKGFVSVKKDEQINNDEVQRLLKTYYTPGLTEMTISSPHGFTQDAETYSSLNQNEKNFHRIFARRKNDDSIVSKLQVEGEKVEKQLVFIGDRLCIF